MMLRYIINIIIFSVLTAQFSNAEVLGTITDPDLPEHRWPISFNGEIVCDESSLRGEELTRCFSARAFYNEILKNGLNFTDLFDEITPHPFSVITPYISKEEVNCNWSKLNAMEHKRCQAVKDFYTSLSTELKTVLIREASSKLNPLELIPLREYTCSQNKLSAFDFKNCLAKKEIIDKMTLKERFTHNANAKRLRSNIILFNIFTQD